MASIYKPALVSEYNTPRARESHAYYDSSYYREGKTTEFIDAVCKALGGVDYHNKDHDIAVIYRPGDIHAMAEIGYKDIRVKSYSTPVKHYFVRANSIENPKYKADSWRYHMIVTNSMKNAIKCAVEHIKPISAVDSLKLTIDVAVRPIEGDLGELNTKARGWFRKLVGESGYGNSFDTPLLRELRNVTFPSAELNYTVAEFSKAVDEWRGAKELYSNPVHFVGLSDNYGQIVADVARCKVGYGVYPQITDPTRIAATQLPEWMQGRITVLQMVKPETYVAGVGLRLDDKVFYIMGDEGV